MTEQITIEIDGRTGEMRFVLDEPLLDLQAALGAGRTRASDVEPVNLGLRVAFRLLRRVCGDRGAVAAWTRRWPGRWIADMARSGGPCLGPFDSRADALAAERAWLRDNIGL